MKDLFDDDAPILTISTAADLLGLHTRTLMLYEYEKLIIPLRNPKGFRMYSKNQIRKIQFIQYLTQKKKLNFAGVKIVLAMIEKGNKAGLDLRKEMFSDYKGD